MVKAVFNLSISTSSTPDFRLVKSFVWANVNVSFFTSEVVTGLERFNPAFTFFQNDYTFRKILTNFYKLSDLSTPTIKWIIITFWNCGCFIFWLKLFFKKCRNNFFIIKPFDSSVTCMRYDYFSVSSKDNTPLPTFIFSMLICDSLWHSLKNYYLHLS